MNGNERRPGTPFEPPWSVDLLADLHAGVLDPQTEAELRPRVDADPEAHAVLAALDATLADLSSLPPLTMPADVAARIDAALATEARQTTGAPVIDLNAARQRKAKRLGWGAGLLTAAAVAVGVVVIALPTSKNGNDTSTGQAQPTPTSASAELPLAVQGEDFGPVFGDVLKAQNYGPLENQETLAGCLQGADITSAKPLGVSPIKLNGKSAVMAILPGGQGPASYRIVVLDPATCGPDNPSGVLANTVIGPK